MMRETVFSSQELAIAPRCFGAQFMNDPTIAASSTRLRSGAQSASSLVTPMYSESNVLDTSTRSKEMEGGMASESVPLRMSFASRHASAQKM
jgi:hypothetical protein